jgi:RimJ/RimL family protein N-acetyltransferase
MTPPLQILPLAPKHERALSQLFFELNARRAVPGLEAFRTHAAVRAFADSTYARPVSCLACVATPADADMIVGAAFVHFPGAELSYMVSPAHWRQGVGAALVQEVMTRCREQLGLSEIHAIVSRDNEASRRLLNRLDFRIVNSGRIRLAPNRDENVDFYTKSLDECVVLPVTRHQAVGRSK